MLLFSNIYYNICNESFNILFPAVKTLLCHPEKNGTNCKKDKNIILINNVVYLYSFEISTVI